MFYGPAGGTGAARGRAAASFGARGRRGRSLTADGGSTGQRTAAPRHKRHEHEPRTRTPVYAAPGWVLYGSATGHGKTYV